MAGGRRRRRARARRGQYHPDVSDESTAGTGTSRPRRPRRGRRRKGKEREAPGAAAAAPKPVVRALEGSQIDATRPPDEPLSDGEAAEMREHLRFLSRHRKTLRLRPNAKEDLLLNGAREPTHRGECLHLLGKVDLAGVQSALTRMPDPDARVELLGGVVRFAGDVGIVLRYLEALADVSSRSAAAGAFSMAVARIDFAEVSAARMRRLLDLIARIFVGAERVQVLFGLLQSHSFRTAFDASSEGLPDELAELFVPLSAVHEVVFEGAENRHGADVLARGLSAVLEAPGKVLRAYPRAVRERLLEVALRDVSDRALADRASAELLDSLPRDGRAFSSLGLVRAGQLLERGDEEAARKTLNEIREAHPDFRLPARWLEALDAPRLGRVALLDVTSTDGGRRRPSRSRGSLAAGFSLRTQRAVWLRTAPPDEAETFRREVDLQRGLAVAGVLPPSDWGVAEDGTAWVAGPAVGRPLRELLDRRKWRRDHAFALALGGVQLLHSLAVGGVVLPDLEPERLLVVDGAVPVLWLADLSGAERARGVPDARALGASWCESALRAVTAGRTPDAVREALAGRAGLPDLAAVLAAWV